jgi:prenyltransferase beta subunit
MGWGFNGTTGPDTDTTAYVLAFLLKVKEKVKNSDLTWLLEQWQPSGGFSTYKGPQAWGVAHADVTPLAYMVLPTQQQVLLKPELLKFLEKNQLSDGTWPAYWWRTNFYSTFLNWQLCRELELEIPIGYLNNLGEVHSIFELAFVLGLFSFQACLNDLKEVLLEELVARQSQEGGWEGGYNLRVTALDCYTPWVESHGELYKDNRGILTTASVIWMLRRFIYNETCL